MGEVGTPPSLHRYLYAFGNPTVYVDPDGHFAWFAPLIAYSLYTGANTTTDTAADVVIEESINLATGQESTTTAESTAQSFGENYVGNFFTGGAYGKVKNAKRVAKVAEEINQYRKKQKNVNKSNDVKITKESRDGSSTTEAQDFKEVKTESQINPDLQARKEAFSKYKQRKGLSESDKVTSEQFKNFKRRHSGDAGHKLYDKKNTGYSKWEHGLNKSPHGNKLDSSGPHDVYAIRDKKTGQVYHFGETGRGWKTRGREWASKLKKEHGLQTEVTPLKKNLKGKKAAKNLETKYIKTYEKIHGEKPFFIDKDGNKITIQKTYH